MRRFGLLLATCLGFTAPFLVACDQSSENSGYVDEFNEVDEALAADIQRLSESPPSPDRLVAFYEDAASSFREAATALKEISPPDDVAELHQELTSEAESLADAISGAANEIKQGGPAAIPGAVEQLSIQINKGTTNLMATIEEINSELEG